MPRGSSDCHHHERPQFGSWARTAADPGVAQALPIFQNAEEIGRYVGTLCDRQMKVEGDKA
jgi:hypothetical protein